MKTVYVIAMFAFCLIAVSFALTHMDPELTGNAVIEKSGQGFFQRLFGMEEEIIEEEPEQVADIELEDNCNAVKVDEEHFGLEANEVCESLGKECYWILAEREKRYHETVDEGVISCDGKIQLAVKEYSFSEFGCDIILEDEEPETVCSRMTGLKSSEPREGDLSLTEFYTKEIMCC